MVIGKIASAERNLINSAPKTAATTFAFSSVFILLLCHINLEFMRKTEVFQKTPKSVFFIDQKMSGLFGLQVLTKMEVFRMSKTKNLSNLGYLFE